MVTATIDPLTPLPSDPRAWRKFKESWIRPTGYYDFWNFPDVDKRLDRAVLPLYVAGRAMSTWIVKTVLDLKVTKPERQNFMTEMLSHIILSVYATDWPYFRSTFKGYHKLYAELHNGKVNLDIARRQHLYLFTDPTVSAINWPALLFYHAYDNSTGEFAFGCQPVASQIVVEEFRDSLCRATWHRNKYVVAVCFGSVTYTEGILSFDGRQKISAFLIKSFYPTVDPKSPAPTSSSTNGTDNDEADDDAGSPSKSRYKVKTKKKKLHDTGTRFLSSSDYAPTSPGSNGVGDDSVEPDVIDLRPAFDYLQIMPNVSNEPELTTRPQSPIPSVSPIPSQLGTPTQTVPQTATTTAVSSAPTILPQTPNDRWSDDDEDDGDEAVELPTTSNVANQGSLKITRRSPPTTPLTGPLGPMKQKNLLAMINDPTPVAPQTAAANIPPPPKLSDFRVVRKIVPGNPPSTSQVAQAHPPPDPVATILNPNEEIPGKFSTLISGGNYYLTKEGADKFDAYIKENGGKQTPTILLAMAQGPFSKCLKFSPDFTSYRVVGYDGVLTGRRPPATEGSLPPNSGPI
jgi:hypothetical protein